MACVPYNVGERLAETAPDGLLASFSRSTSCEVRPLFISTRTHHRPAPSNVVFLPVWPHQLLQRAFLSAKMATARCAEKLGMSINRHLHSTN